MESGKLQISRQRASLEIITKNQDKPEYCRKIPLGQIARPL